MALWPHSPELPSRVNANQTSVTMTVAIVDKHMPLWQARSVGVVLLKRHTSMAPWTPTRAVGCLLRTVPPPSTQTRDVELKIVNKTGLSEPKPWGAMFRYSLQDLFRGSLIK